MEETLRAHLLDLSVRYREASGATISAVGSAALGDHRFLRRLEKGEGFNVRTFDKLVLWFSLNWPEGAKWPAEVPRPEPSVAPAQEGAAA